MPKFRVPSGGEALFDIVSYGRGGPRENGGRLTHEQVEQIRRTVKRTPEVMVKVLPRASNDLKAAANHLDYISRYGGLELETDSGLGLQDERGMALLEEWDLDIDDARRQTALAGTQGRTPAKLVHKLMFSMPAGTPPDKVLTAVRNLAREEFWGQHRYAFVLHTDEDHPHVHLVLKAMNEQGVRLNIRKAKLRHWRSEFAKNLRQLGVPANATERAVRGQDRKSAKDGIFRASLRGASSHVRERVESVAAELSRGNIRIEQGKSALLTTRENVKHGWRATTDRLVEGGHRQLADEVLKFIERMSEPQTDREWIATGLSDSSREKPPRVR